MREPPDPERDVVERARQLLEAAESARVHAEAQLDLLGQALPALLPEGIRVEDSFVAAAGAELMRQGEMLALIAVEVEQRERPEGLEVAVTMLDSVFAQLAGNLAATTASLAPFSAAGQDPTGEAAVVAEVSAVRRVAAELGRLQDRLDGLARSRRALEEDARTAAAQKSWRAVTEGGQEELIWSLWQQVLRGVGRFDRLARGAGLDGERLVRFQDHLLKTALRLEAEIADSDRDRSPPDEATPPSEPPAERYPLTVKLDVPDPVGLGEPFELALLVRNDHPVPVTLDSIDLDAGLLAGFDVLDLGPEPVERVRGPGGGMALEYEREIAAMSALRVVLVLRGRRPGNFTGEVSVWTDRVEVSTTVPNLDVVVLQ